MYKPGKTNLAADALSRTPAASFHAISGRTFDLIADLRQANANHPELLAWKQSIHEEAETPSAFLFKDGLLLYNGRLVIPSDSPLRIQLLKELHSSPVGGHAGISRTFQRVASNFFLEGFTTRCQNLCCFLPDLLANEGHS